MNSTSRKRTISTSFESIAVDIPIAKKNRTESGSAIAFSSLAEDVPVELPTSYSMEFNFGELAHEFVSTPVPGNDMAAQSFESFFADSPLNIFTVNETSDISSDDEKQAAKVEPKVEHLPSSPLSSESPSKTDEATSVANNQSDPNQKRQADRAARNRESSRRAREKAKNRFRALENDNLALREMVRRFRIQNEHLLSQLDRANVLQQSCSMCRYNSTIAQQPACPAPQQSMLRQ